MDHDIKTHGPANQASGGGGGGGGGGLPMSDEVWVRLNCNDRVWLGHANCGLPLASRSNTICLAVTSGKQYLHVNLSSAYACQQVHAPYSCKVDRGSRIAQKVWLYLAMLMSWLLGAMPGKLQGSFVHLYVSKMQHPCAT